MNIKFNLMNFKSYDESNRFGHFQGNTFQDVCIGCVLSNTALFLIRKIGYFGRTALTFKVDLWKSTTFFNQNVFMNAITIDCFHSNHHFGRIKIFVQAH